MKAKPFVKWVGGKTQLIDQLEAMLHRRKDSTLSIEELKLIIQQNND